MHVDFYMDTVAVIVSTAAVFYFGSVPVFSLFYCLVPFKMGSNVGLTDSERA